ncbi:hypothetical protein [Spirosoma pomorum]
MIQTNTTKISLLAALIALGAACSADKKADHDHAGHDHSTKSETSRGPVGDLEDEVMAVHDSAMNDMSDVMRLRKAVDQKLTSATGSDKDKGTDIRNRLQQADKQMMDWMHGYNGDTLGKLDQAKALDYLKAEQQKVLRVQDLMKKSIADAKAYVE